MAEDFTYYCLSCQGTFVGATLTACPYCGSGSTAPAETVNTTTDADNPTSALVEVVGGADTLTCAYCGQEYPRQFFYLRADLSDPDPICWGCSDEVERGTLAPHYPDDEVAEEPDTFDFAEEDDGRDSFDYYGRPTWLRW